MAMKKTAPSKSAGSRSSAKKKKSPAAKKVVRAPRLKKAHTFAALPDNCRGAQLINALRRQMLRYNITQAQMAEKLGLSSNHVSFLLSGQRWFGSCAPEVLQRCAEILNASRAQVYLMAQVLVEEDFVIPNEREQVMEHIGRTVLEDPRTAGFIGNMATWNSFPDKAKTVIGLLYQAMSGTELVKMPELPDEEALRLPPPRQRGIH